MRFIRILIRLNLLFLLLANSSLFAQEKVTFLFFNDFHSQNYPFREDAEVEVINEIGARIGDRILIDIKTSAFLKATFLLYVFPIIGLTVGAMLGVKVSEHFGYDASVCSAAIGFAAFFLTVAIVRIEGNRMGRQKAYRPQIVKILPPLTSPPADLRNHCPV